MDEIQGWSGYGSTTRVCPKCDGTQILIIPAVDDTPPENAFGAHRHLGTVVYWAVWCDCQEGWV